METNPEADYGEGWVPFLDCKIFLDSRPLIPRLETEYWVEKVIEILAAEPLAAPRALDLFAGSGAIGIALLKHLPHWSVDFGEINEAHFPTIQKSLRENAIDLSRAQLIQTDVWSAIPGTYNAILANPPYIAKDSQDVAASVISHEPSEALFAEENGFALIRKTIEGAPAHLLPGGTLFIEHDPEQTEALQKLAQANGFEAETKPDQFKNLRYSALKFMQ